MTTLTSCEDVSSQIGLFQQAELDRFFEKVLPRKPFVQKVGGA